MEKRKKGGGGRPQDKSTRLPLTPHLMNHAEKGGGKERKKRKGRSNGSEQLLKPVLNTGLLKGKGGGIKVGIPNFP